MADFDHYIRIRFGLAPGEPDAAQLDKIVQQVESFARSLGREPTVDELRDIVAAICPSTGTWKYGADVNAELRRQLAAIRAQAKR